MVANDTISCPVCAATDTAFFANARDLEYRTTDEVFRYWRCGDCESVFLPNPPADRLNLIYPKNYYSYTAAVGNPLLERVKRSLDARLLQRLLKQIPGDRLAVLDVGGGWGWLLGLLRDLSPRIAETHEVDIDAGARAMAEAEGHRFHCTRVEEFEAEQRFDLILLLNMIEHVEDPRRVLAAMRRLLTAEGRVLVKTPNTDTWDRRLFQRSNWGGFHCPRHFVLFTMPGLTRLAAEVGLEVDDAAYTQGGPQWAVSLLGWLTDRQLITVTAERPMYRHPLYSAMLAMGVAIDFMRRPFAPTAQMFLTLKLAGRG